MAIRELTKESREIEILPKLKHTLLISVSKLSDAGYITVFDPVDGGVNVYLTDDIAINVKKEAVIKGWRDKSGLWRIPIKKEVDNVNTDTLLLQRPIPSEAAQNVYKLPSTEKVVRYLHAALGYPTKATFTKAILQKWLLSWPQLTVGAVNEFFPETGETQKGHMKQQRKGVRSTKVRNVQDEVKQDANAISILTTTTK